jgi:hypothetical protein
MTLLNHLTMIILLDCPFSIKRYIAQLHRYNQDVECPRCHKRMRKHGSYKRNVVYKKNIYPIPVLRRRCKGCNVTCSLLPCFVRAWSRFANHIREGLGRWHLIGIPLYRLPHYLETVGISLRTLYRWKSTWGKKFEAWLILQRRRLVIEYDQGDGLLGLYRFGMTSEQERVITLSLFLRDIPFPRVGALVSKVNLLLPPEERW